MSAPPVFPGQVVAGKYRIERILGEGGHGVVVAAQHMALGEKVAIKVLRPDFATDREVVARFLREARAAVRIKGEHVTRVLDVGSMEDGAPYMVMEHLVGHDLRQVLNHRTRLPIATAVDYVLQTCEALAEAHGIGIVHRDVKPENLFLTRRSDGTPWIKVLDFGISKAMPQAAGNETAPSFTQTQNVVGSPQYMAPEQMANPKLIDPRTDVWGLGVTLYELIAGGPPFTAGTLPEIFAKILRDPPPPINRPDLPPELLRVIGRCLAKDVTGRYTTVAELARALAPFAQASSPDIAERINRVGVLAYQSGTRLPATSSRDVMEAFEPPPPPPSSSTRTAAIAGALFGVIALGGAYLGLRLSKRPEPPPAPLVAGEPSATPSASLAIPEAPAIGLVASAEPAVSEPASSATPAASLKRPVTAHPRVDAPKAPTTTAPTKTAGVASSRYD
ncbi:MAG: serine/threonine-protein kinase [Labilithrix sp.]